MPTTIDQPPPPPRPDIAAAGPRTFDEVIGQRQVVEQLRVTLSAREREATTGGAFPISVGMFGPPGLGKTSLTAIAARSMGAELREALGQSLTAGEALTALLLDAADSTFLFIDEADELGVPAQSQLLRAIEERVLLVPKRGGNGGQFTRVPLSRFSLALVSNRPAALLPALRERLSVVLHFELYSDGDLAEVCRRRADALGWRVDPAVHPLVARCGRGVPRLAIRLLASCRRTALAAGDDTVRVGHFDRTCELEGIDPVLGLDKVERGYLRILYDAVTLVRPSVLASRLGCLTLRQTTEVTEAFLVRRGLIMRTDKGRGLTQDGLTHARRLFGGA